MGESNPRGAQEAKETESWPGAPWSVAGGERRGGWDRRGWSWEGSWERRPWLWLAGQLEDRGTWRLKA